MTSIVGTILRRIGGEVEYSDRLSADALRQMRSERMKQAVSNTVPMTISNMIFPTMIAWWFWGRGADVVLFAWALVLVALNAFGLYKYLMRDNNKPFSGSPRAFKSLTRQAFALAALYGIAPFFLIPIASGSDAAIIAGMAASSGVIGPYIFYAVPQAAIVWLFTATLFCTTSFFYSMDGSFIVSALFGIMIASGVGQATLTQSKRLTEQFVARQKLQEKQDVISLLLQEHEENSTAWVWECDEAGTMTRIPAQLKSLLYGDDAEGDETLTLAALVGREISGDADKSMRLLAQDIHAQRALRELQLEIPMQGDGSPEETRWLSLRGKPHLNADGSLYGFRGIISDITESKIAQDKIRFMAGHDSLTKLANRITFGEGLQPWIDAQQPFATLHLDLDRFKLVNDTLGHLAGDQLLIQVAERLKKLAKKADSDAIVARIGGDEFVIGLPLSYQQSSDFVDVTTAEALAAHIVKELAQPFALEAGSASIGVSVGYVVYPEDCENAADMSSFADLALYRAKYGGRGQFARFQAGMDKRAHDRRQIEADLQKALQKNQMRVVYQPVVDLDTGIVSGAEALLRWNHPDMGEVTPECFVPVAEESGVIVELGKWILKQACLEAATWDKPLTIAVNVSAKQILRDDFVPTVLDTLAQTKLPPKRLELELTESILVQDANTALKAIRSLRKLGVSVVLDDFGTGYSSLSYLRDFAFDKIKIDKSFIGKLGEEDADETQGANTLVNAIVNLAKTLGMRTTAEGIEDERQADDLRQMGCNIGQGYLFARPVTADELKAITGLGRLGDKKRQAS